MWMLLCDCESGQLMMLMTSHTRLTDDANDVSTSVHSRTIKLDSVLKESLAPD